MLSRPLHVHISRIPNPPARTRIAGSSGPRFRISRHETNRGSGTTSEIPKMARMGHLEPYREKKADCTNAREAAVNASADAPPIKSDRRFQRLCTPFQLMPETLTV